jgi:hypothetical protein
MPKSTEKERSDEADKLEAVECELSSVSARETSDVVGTEISDETETESEMRESDEETPVAVEFPALWEVDSVPGSNVAP